jgi:lipopolysaccharide biosynthesis glycosyltransferase
VKLLITCRADKNITDQTDISFPFMREYCSRVGADFKILDHESGCTHEEGRWHYRILKHFELLQDYDRVLHLDADVLVSPKCPDIFQEVPVDCIGTVWEDQGSRTGSRRDKIRDIQKHFHEISWQTGYINTGVFLTSKLHQSIFQKIEGEFWESWGHDDVHLGYQLNQQGFKQHILGFQWNHMTMFSEPWNGSPCRFDSYIIHYAGAGRFDSKHRNKISQMKADAAELRRR